MKKLYYSIASTALLALPVITNAQLASGDSDAGDFEIFLENILGFINGVLIPFIIGIGFLVFVWGMFWYFILGGADEEKRKQGRSLMIYATLGFVLIIVFWGIINLLTGALFSDNDLRELDNVPVVGGDRPNTAP